MHISIVLSEGTHLSWMARLSYDTLYGLPPKSANEGYDELAALAPTNARIRIARILELQNESRVCNAGITEPLSYI